MCVSRRGRRSERNFINHFTCIDHLNGHSTASISIQVSPSNVTVAQCTIVPVYVYIDEIYDESERNC